MTLVFRSIVAAGLLVFAAPALAKSGGIKFAPDYSDLRGFNYSPVSAKAGVDKWIQYDHAEIDRDFGYAERLKLNGARVFLSYQAWLADRQSYDANIRNYTRTAFAHHIGVMFVVVDGPQRMMPDLFEESAKPKLREYAQDLIRAVGSEPGLMMWDVANEPDWVHPPGQLPNTNQAQRIKVARFMAQTFKELDRSTPVTIGCMMLDCTRQTADVVDVLTHHDYSQTRAQVDADIVRAQKMAAEFKKPAINNEMACIGRANPYDIEIEEHDKAHMGWMVFELMIAPYWGNVHGITYADGTVRDPAIVAALFGFFRNRGPDVVLEESDREGITSGVLQDAHKWLADTKPDWFDGMVIAETEANTLEAAQLVAMRELPTRKVEMLRTAPPNILALRLLIKEFSGELATNAIPGELPLHRYYTPAVPH
jgi:Glycosyl hydrolases family 2, TIM barrel domain